MEFCMQGNCTNDMSQYVLSAASYASGELAATLNANVVKSSNGIKTYYTMKDGQVVLGTEANQTRKVTFKCADVDDLVVYYNGGETIALNYADNVEKYEITAGTATLNGSELTMGTTDLTIQVTLDGLNYALLKAAMAKYDGKNTNYFVAADGTSLTELFTQANAYIANTVEGATQDDVNALTDKINGEMSYADYPNLPKAGEVGLYPDAPGYLVGTLADLEDVQKNVASYTADQTIHLTENITVTEGSAANNLNGLKASIDGHEKAIKNVKFAGGGTSGDGYLGYYAGASIQNLVLEGWEVTNLGWGGGMLIAVSDKDLVIKNVTVKNCSASSSDSNYHSFLVGNNRGGNLTMEDIRVEGSTFVQPASASDNAGMILGRFYSSGTLTIKNVYAIDNTITGSGLKANAMGGLIGELQLSQAATISNVALVNTTYDEGAYLSGLVIGRLKKGDVTLSNVIAAADGYENLPLVSRKEEGSDIPGTVTLTNVYTDAAYMESGHGIAAPVAGNATAEEIANGTVAYKLNGAGVEKTWAIVDGTPVMATTGLPLAITYAIADVEYEVAAEVADVTLYTDAEGNLLGMTAAVKAALEEAAVWGSDVKWEGTFAEAVTYTGTPYPKHQDSHETTLIKNADGVNHTIVCTHKEGEVACKFTDAAACQFDEIVCADENALPADAKHQAKCDCGNVDEAVSCNTGDATQWVKTEQAATTEAEGFIKHECKVCGYTHTETLAKLLAITADVPDGYAGEQLEIEVGLQSNPGVSGEVVTVTYDPSVMSWEGFEASFTLAENRSYANVKKDNDGNELGEVKIALLHDGTYSGESLVTLIFNVVEGAAEGEYDFAVAISASDFEGTMITIEDYNGKVKIFDFLRGDVSNDKKVSVADAVLLLRMVNEDPNLTVTVNENAADVDGNGEVEIADVIKILQFLNGSIDTLEPTA